MLLSQTRLFRGNFRKLRYKVMLLGLRARLRKFSNSPSFGVALWQCVQIACCSGMFGVRGKLGAFPQGFSYFSYLQPASSRQREDTYLDAFLARQVDLLRNDKILLSEAVCEVVAAISSAYFNYADVDHSAGSSARRILLKELLFSWYLGKRVFRPWYVKMAISRDAWKSRASNSMSSYGKWSSREVRVRQRNIDEILRYIENGDIDGAIEKVEIIL